jgi:hypothetical protein
MAGDRVSLRKGISDGAIAGSVECPCAGADGLLAKRDVEPAADAGDRDAAG